MQLAHPSQSNLTNLFLLCLMACTGCVASQKQNSELLPSRSSYRTGPFVIHSHKSLRHKDPVVQELESLTRKVVSLTGASTQKPDAKVDVYILSDEMSFKHFLQYYHPELPERRAYFIATATSRSVYTYEGDHLMEDLRHEATHAIVNLTHPGLPLWLDEGLAEVFEHPDSDPKPDTHSERFLADIQAGVVPNLQHLEGVDDVRRLTPTNYREAWAWASWGLEGPIPVRNSFRSYMDDVMRLGMTESEVALKPLSTRWAELPEIDSLNPTENQMLSWVRQSHDSLWGEKLAKSPKSDTNLNRTRLQDDSQATAEPEPVQSQTMNRNRKPGGLRGFFQRIWGG